MVKPIRVKRTNRLVGTILDVSYHRNGISGTGFWAVLFKGHADSEETMIAGKTFIATRFDHSDEEEAGNYRIAVLRLGDLVNGDASFAWRGDNFVEEIDAAIGAWKKENWR